mmetsp:Transcript_48265/g.79998  ORF Transcript_48265/g.79998 Transcript_48265/m.79998 type:complete len:182 (+) Transcript_48265:404-949(+)
MQNLQLQMQNGNNSLITPPPTDMMMLSQPMQSRTAELDSFLQKKRTPSQATQHQRNVSEDYEVTATTRVTLPYQAMSHVAELTHNESDTKEFTITPAPDSALHNVQFPQNLGSLRELVDVVVPGMEPRNDDENVLQSEQERVAVEDGGQLNHSVEKGTNSAVGNYDDRAMLIRPDQLGQQK